MPFFYRLRDVSLIYGDVVVVAVVAVVAVVVVAAEGVAERADVQILAVPEIRLVAW